MSRIHPEALVDPSAEIADNVETGAFSLVGPRVKIDSGSRFDSLNISEKSFIR
jgi:UDP-N-acetylglucosamine acyltransferase